MSQPPTHREIWQTSTALAAGLLHDRPARRRFMARLLVAVMIILAVGNWALHHWLAASVWRFLIWWGACAILTVLLLLLALFDALAVFGEEREKFKKEFEDDDGDQPGG